MAINVTPRFQEAVRKRRANLVKLGEPVPDLLARTARTRSAFAEEAQLTMQKIRSTAKFLHESHAAYLADDGLTAEAAAERDAADAETQQFLKVCSGRIEGLSSHAMPANGSSASPQVALHRRETCAMLYEQLKRVAGIFDEHRGQRLRRAAEARDQRLGTAAEAAGRLPAPQTSASAPRSVYHSLVNRSFGSSDTAEGGGGGHDEGHASLELGDEEVLSDGEYNDAERAQLQEENETLQKELESMVTQARQAETHALELSKLNHLFAANIEQQASGVDTLLGNTEQALENIYDGNAHIDSAARHARDSRLFVLTFLLVAIFALAFLDWYY